MTSMVATRQPISPQAAARYRERWAIARERLDEELRATSMEAKLHQLANLMQSAREMGWSRSLDEEDDAVRARWMALRRASLAKRRSAGGRQGPPAPLREKTPARPVRFE